MCTLLLPIDERTQLGKKCGWHFSSRSVEVENRMELDMEMKKPETLLSPGGRLNYHKEFAVPARFPRGTPIEEIKKCMQNIEEPEIFLRELDEDVEIVIKLRKPKDILPDAIWKVLEKDGVTLPRVFEALLWKKPDAHRSNMWSQLARPATESYRQLWLEFFRMGYVGHSHPVREVSLAQTVTEMDSEGKVKPRRGRSTSPKAEIPSLWKRYKELLATCVYVHTEVEAVLSSLRIQNKGKDPNRAEIRRAVFNTTRKSIGGLSLSDLIFSGVAFQEHYYALKHAHLHDPKSWRPRRLAISLLALERSQGWETIEKKLRRQKAADAVSTLARI
jgi:hypothetical protein